jgi:tetratricopeptide (TPR) repeat protein
MADFGQAIALDPKYPLAYKQSRRGLEGQGKFRPRHRRLRPGNQVSIRPIPPPIPIEVSPTSAFAALASRPPALGGSVSPLPDPGTPGRRIALVIGNSAYAAVQPLANHPNVADTFNNLANVYQFQGKYAEAEGLLKRALAIYEQALGANHLTVTWPRSSNLALVYESQGKHAEPVGRDREHRCEIAAHQREG